MSRLVIVDAGHGRQTSGKRSPVISSLGRYIPEWEGNQLIATYLSKELVRCGFKVQRADDVTGVTDVHLKNRTASANRLGADFYISCHHNAGGGEGLETFSYPSSTKSYRASKLILEELMNSGVPRKNRGAKTADFHVLRETRMPAVLVEYGFMDCPKNGYQEARDMLNDEVAKKQAIATAKGICRYFGVEYKPESLPPKIPSPKPSLMYRLEIEGQEPLDTAYRFDLISKKVLEHLQNARTGVIRIYPRD